MAKRLRRLITTWPWHPERMELDFVSLGEVMIQLNATTPGPLRHVNTFERHVAGSEANTIVGLSRLGYRTGLISRVGDDEFGMAVLNALKAEGVDASHVRVGPDHMTGIYFTQRHFPVPGQTVMTYYRRGSAASHMDEGDVDEEFISGAGHLHLTGITPALSDSCGRAVRKAFGFARSSGLGLSFDTNIRPKLWKDLPTAVSVISTYLASRIVFTNEEDLDILFPGLGFRVSAQRVLDKGAEVVAVKRGARGAYAVTKAKQAEIPAFTGLHVEDVTGAGDAFDASFLASYLKGYGLEDCLRNANAAGALVASVRGDMEALPRWEDLRTFLKSTL